MFTQKKVIITSNNPVKRNAVEEAFRQVFPLETFVYEEVRVKSGVEEQPMSDEETFRGAFQRALHAKSAYPAATFWIGIEGGIQEINDNMDAFAWIVILSKDGYGKSRTSTFQLPNEICKLVKQGYELGTANDIYFQKVNSKQDTGAVGILTCDIITRTVLYVQSLILALIPHRNETLFTI